MKKIYLLLLTVVAITVVAFSQVPETFNYQAVVRNSSGEVIANKQVSFRITLLRGRISPLKLYSEKQVVTTNEFGLVNFRIGKGTKLSGDFSADNWGGAMYLKVELDPNGGNAFSELSNKALSSVPFAFKAQVVENDKVNDADHDATNEIQELSLTGGNQLKLSKNGGSVTLPTSGGSSLWSQTGNNIAYRSGRVDVGQAFIGDAYSLMNVNAGNEVALSLSNNSTTYATLMVKNDGAGRTAIFNGEVIIADGTEGKGKVLTSNNVGGASWQNPAWKLSSGGQKAYTSGKVGIGLDSPIFDLDILRVGSDAGINIKTTSGNAYMLIDRPNNGKAADVAFKTNGQLKFMAGLLPGSDNYRISASYGSLKGLEVEPDGDVNITNELHTAATGQANMVPVAFGYVQSNGSIFEVKSTPNFTGVAKTGTGRYDLTITGIKFNGTSYNVFVTNITTEPRVFSVGYNPATSNIYVFAYDLDGNLVDSAFSFIVYKGNGN